jgi:hypothetical protein
MGQVRAGLRSAWSRLLFHNISNVHPVTKIGCRRGAAGLASPIADLEEFKPRL